MEFPILKKIREADQVIRIYALNGLAMSFTNEIEDLMFYCYVGSSGMSWEQAAKAFYDKTRFQTKQDLADKAITTRLSDEPDALAMWKGIKREIQGLLGPTNNLRNLIGHNTVDLNLYAPSGAVSSPENPHVTIIALQEVQQKVAMVRFRDRPETKAGDSEMAAYCEQLLELFITFDRFALTALSIGHALRLRYARGEEG